MAGLFKPTYKDKKTGRTRKTAKWYGWMSDPSGKKLRKPLATDKGVAQTMLAQWIKEVEQEAAGIRDPYAEHRKRPLSEHLDEWEAFLTGKARPTPEAQAQAKVTAFRARSVIEACGFQRIGDLSAARVLEAVAALRVDAPPSANRKRHRGLSLQTCNFYVKACRQFCRWLVRDRRCPHDPLGHIETFNVRLDRRHDRRALDAGEIAWLLRATRAAGEWRGLSGIDRSMLYQTAVGTGLRAAELSSLTVGSFQLDGRPPTVRLLAAYAKNETQVDQPLPADLVAALRPWLAGRPARQAAWPGTWSERSARMLRLDLAAARAAWLAEAQDAAERGRREASSFLAYEDGAGLYADFHALRHTYITMLVRSGVSPKMAQSLARHSDINLTMSRYTHVGLHDQAAALEALPPLSPPETETQGGPEKAAG